MILLRTAPNPAFKLAQPLPRLAINRLAVHNREGPFAIPGPPRGGAGDLKSPAPPPDRPLSGEGGEPSPSAVNPFEAELLKQRGESGLRPTFLP